MVNFRATTQADKPVIGTWIASDPAHRDRMDSSFFADGEGKASVYCIGDEQGPVMFVRQEVEGESTRLHTQFPPDAPGIRKRVAEALHEAYPVVAADAKSRGFKQVVFESESPALIRYMIGTFGFTAELRGRL
jgi:hypothetical protein